MKSSFKSKQKIVPLNHINPGMRICTCTKTKCLKKYCECLSNNQYCYNCNCIDCHNNPDYQNENLKDDKDLSVCTCTKSNCNKKYCECYKVGEKCNNNCRCINCFNKNSILEKKQFLIERISVLIENKQIFIQKNIIWDFSHDEKYLNKKTERENLNGA